MIKEVTYARLYAMPDNKYENERFEAVAIVQDGDVKAAWGEAYAAIETEHDRVIASRKAPAPALQGGVPGGPATDKQRSYIAVLQNNLAWTSEQLSAYANQQDVDLAGISMRQASDLINSMKRLAEVLRCDVEPVRGISDLINGMKRMAEKRSDDRPLADNDLPF